MQAKLFWTAFICTLLVGSYELGTHRTTAVKPVPPHQTQVQAPITSPSDHPEELAKLKVVGPLALWMQTQDANDAGLTPEQVPVAPPYQPSEQDKLVHVPKAAPSNFLNRTFAVKDCSAFAIELPPGTLTASLSGSYESFLVTSNQERQAADIELLLLDADNFRAFTRGKAPSAVYSTEAAATNSVKWLLTSSYSESKKYFLVFSNPGRRTKLVKANFTIKYS